MVCTRILEAMVRGSLAGAAVAHLHLIALAARLESVSWPAAVLRRPAQLATACCTSSTTRGMGGALLAHRTFAIGHELSRNP